MRKFVVIIAVLFVLTACAASAGPSSQPSSDPPNCTWGASSITASSVNGQVVESEPQTSGCT
jgi:hypothetical protein